MSDDAQEISEVANLVMSIMSKEDAGPSTASSASLASGKYLAERLLDVKVGGDGKKYYLVKWYGYPLEESTWERQDQLACEYMMRELEEKKQRQAQNGGQPGCTQHHTDPSEYVCGRLTGFDLGHTPELILGATEKDGELHFLIKWKGIFEADLIPRSIANERCPELVIEFYEERLHWSTPQELTEDEEEIDVVAMDKEGNKEEK